MTRGISVGLASRAVESSNRLNPTSTISEEDGEEDDHVIQSPTSASFSFMPSKDDSSIVTNNTGIPSFTRYSHAYSKSMGTLGRSNSSTITPSRNFPPLVSTSTGTAMGGVTGTRYGTALTGQPTGRSSARTWGSGTPNCGRCGQSVFFAEQIKAVGKTFHKSCLKCTECNTSLDSTKLTEKDGDPLCRRCYGKVFGFTSCVVVFSRNHVSSFTVHREADMHCWARRVDDGTRLYYGNHE
jgi:LIM domain